MPATCVDESYPRPQLVRADWQDLCGWWEFAVDQEDRGVQERWYADDQHFPLSILVPFPPESSMSGIHDAAVPAVLWYRRDVVLDDAHAVANSDDRLILHFGAVDYRARVWVDGTCLGEHEGGHTPFSFDVTDAIDPAASRFQVVLRAEDQPDDPEQPRGKQTSAATASGIAHPRTSGIWQPVWLERRPAVAVERLTWTPDLPGARVRLAVRLSRRPRRPVALEITLRLGEEILAQQSVRLAEQSAVVDVAIPAATDSRQVERLLWSPERPTLLDAELRLLEDGRVRDQVASYVGFRSVGVADGRFLLNGRVYPLRAVLEQGFWPQSHLAAPDAGALRREVELTKDLGFNGVRLHQKVEDPRYLGWCDRLGLLVWAEMPSAYRFGVTAMSRLTREWLEVLQRDASSPAVVTWVPFNESWGVPHIDQVDAHRRCAAALAELTRAVDPSRPVIANDGWENAHSDIVGVHDYTGDPLDLLRRYGDAEALAGLLGSGRPWRRRICLPGHQDQSSPVVLSEFGGVSSTPGTRGGWAGHVTVQSSAGLAEKLQELFAAVHASTALAGFCYTQLTDTACETNGLLDAQRRPKLPVEELRAVVTGQPRVELPRARRPVAVVR